MKIRIVVTEKRVGLGHSKNATGKFETKKSFTVQATPEFPGGEETHPNFRTLGAAPVGSISFEGLSEETAQSFEVGKTYEVDFKPVTE